MSNVPRLKPQAPNTVLLSSKPTNAEPRRSKRYVCQSKSIPCLPEVPNNFVKEANVSDQTTNHSITDMSGDNHEGYSCNNCSGDIVGYRYRCVQCVDYDLCALCEARCIHSLHYVLRIPGPRPYLEIEKIMKKIRKQLKYGVDSIVPSSGLECGKPLNEQVEEVGDVGTKHFTQDDDSDLCNDQEEMEVTNKKRKLSDLVETEAATQSRRLSSNHISHQENDNINVADSINMEIDDEKSDPLDECEVVVEENNKREAIKDPLDDTGVKEELPEPSEEKQVNEELPTEEDNGQTHDHMEPHEGATDTVEEHEIDENQMKDKKIPTSLEHNLSNRDDKHTPNGSATPRDTAPKIAVPYVPDSTTARGKAPHIPDSTTPHSPACASARKSLVMSSNVKRGTPYRGARIVKVIRREESDVRRGRHKARLVRVAIFSKDEYVATFRLTEDLIRQLTDELSPYLQETRRKGGCSTRVKMLSALSFFANGSHQKILGNHLKKNLSQPSASRFINEIASALCHPAIVKKYIRFPQNAAQRNKLKERFSEKFKISGAIGSVDGTFVSMKRPSGHEERYYCRGNYHARNVQVIVDADTNILHVDASYGGATHDSFIFNYSEIKSHLEDVNNSKEVSYLLGDSEYAQLPYMMTPVLDAETTSEAFYNQLHAAARNTVDRALVVLKGRFRCLLVTNILHYHPDTVAKIAIACCVLHNFCNAAGLPSPDLNQEELDKERRFINDVQKRQRKDVPSQIDSQMGRLARAQLIRELWHSRV